MNVPEKRVFELYNLSKDPSEKRNLIKRHPKLVAELKAIMKEAHTESPVWKFIDEK